MVQSRNRVHVAPRRRLDSDGSSPGLQPLLFQVDPLTATPWAPCARFPTLLQQMEAPQPRQSRRIPLISAPGQHQTVPLQEPVQPPTADQRPRRFDLRILEDDRPRRRSRRQSPVTGRPVLCDLPTGLDTWHRQRSEATQRSSAVPPQRPARSTSSTPPTATIALVRATAQSLPGSQALMAPPSSYPIPAPLRAPGRPPGVFDHGEERA